MTIEFNDKGKIFTDVIRKIPTPVKITLASGHLLGHIHIREGRRIKDVLDSPDAFLAVTEAEVFNPEGTRVEQSPFLAVRKSQIVLVIPLGEPDSSSDPNGGVG